MASTSVAGQPLPESPSPRAASSFSPRWRPFWWPQLNQLFAPRKLRPEPAYLRSILLGAGRVALHTFWLRSVLSCSKKHFWHGTRWLLILSPCVASLHSVINLIIVNIYVRCKVFISLKRSKSMS